MLGLHTIVQSQARWNILEARNAVEAKTAATRSRPEIIVISNKRSQLDGVLVTHSILTADSGLRVLMLSDDITLIQKAFEAGVLGYLLKSQVETDLLVAIDQLLVGRTFFTAETIRLLRVRYHRNPYREEHKPLTPREVVILAYIAEGKSNKDIANILGISIRTVENHRAEIMKTLNFGNVCDLVRYAVRAGLIEP